jgi:hypothetical protein
MTTEDRQRVIDLRAGSTNTTEYVNVRSADILWLCEQILPAEQPAEASPQPAVDSH